LKTSVEDLKKNGMITNYSVNNIFVVVFFCNYLF